jgi:hypothetical protein
MNKNIINNISAAPQQQELTPQEKQYVQEVKQEFQLDKWVD